MKVLYIGHYKEGTGWSNAAMDYILALDSIGIDVVCKNIKLTDANPTIPSRILELENKKLDNIDFCIQHVLPHHLVATQKFKKNIAFFVSESSTIKHTNWYYNLKTMDQVWVPTQFNKNVLVEDGFEEDKIKIVPHTFNISKYQHITPKVDLKVANDKFKFYFIGDINDRKNLQSIIRCFHSEFDVNDNVALILKVKKYKTPPAELSQIMLKNISDIKSSLRIHKDLQRYIKDVIITQEMNDEEIQALHQTCDCFIGASHGEAWSIPAFEAMCYGKTPICSNEGGPSEFIDPEDKNTGYLVDGQYEICQHSDPAFPDLFTGREYWFAPSEKEIKKAMRYYYENQNITKNMGLKRAMKYSYSTIANQIKDILND